MIIGQPTPPNWPPPRHSFLLGRCDLDRAVKKANKSRFPGSFAFEVEFDLQGTLQEGSSHSLYAYLHDEGDHEEGDHGAAACAEDEDEDEDEDESHPDQAECGFGAAGEVGASAPATDTPPAADTPGEEAHS